MMSTAEHNETDCLDQSYFCNQQPIAIAYTFSGSLKDAVYYGECGGDNRSVVSALKRLATKLEVPYKELMVCYEAGPSAFVLARRQEQLGLDCVLMSPSKTERKPGYWIKTNKRDALNIAKLFRNGDINELRIPLAFDEAVRDVCRARTDASDDLSRAKRRLSPFLLCNGYRYSSKSKWTPAHMRYLRELTLSDPAQKIVLEEPEQSTNQ